MHAVRVCMHAGVGGGNRVFGRSLGGLARRDNKQGHRAGVAFISHAGRGK